ncbi:MAG: hypothetical protein M1814_005788 [Vezdaea aestivalis]|nr:MAG: hypothetical protein M1814_005788 [Vezdaea aestivalis]
MISSSTLLFLTLALNAPRSSSHPVDGLDKRIFWCPFMPDIDFTYVWPWAGETPLPTGHLVWVPTDESIKLVDDYADAPPATKVKARDTLAKLETRREPVGVEVRDAGVESQPITRDLEVRAGERLFEAKNYRAIAENAGVFMIHTVFGLIANVGAYVGLLPPRAWAGDHVFELNLFRSWVAANVGPLTLKTIYECQSVYDRFEGILNSPANLVGVDASLNNLKMTFLQKNGPLDPSLYPQGVYNAMQHYFDLIKPNYDGIAQRLGDAINDVARDQGEKLVGGAFVTYATGRFARAISLLKPFVNLQGQSMLGNRWTTVSVR